ncbi:hypothetical protein BCON_0380g00010 [Botryotinia convoluta]|uniref:Uncharacterized protein n=1 Tax=Botryotinia convoluta TaxID=54673 RepID=A0A4Z1HKR4_9HELO|nr:hypothetical protein BCON_0380g00010 [Botryotinia convoluta]
MSVMDIMRQRRGSEWLISIVDTYIKQCKSFHDQVMAIRCFEVSYEKPEWSHAQYKRILSSSLQLRSRDCCLSLFEMAGVWKAKDNIEM